MNLVNKTINVLQSSFQQLCFCRSRVTNPRSISSDQIREFHLYIASALPLLLCLFENGSWWQCECMFVLFLPVFAWSGRIACTPSSQLLTSIISDICFRFPRYFSKVWRLEIYISKGRSPPHCLRLCEMVKLLRPLNNLRMIKVTSPIRSKFIKCIAKCCPNLEGFDCTNSSSVISDNALRALGKLQCLSFVMLPQHTYYSRRTVKRPYTGKGIARLMKSLPCLVRLECLQCVMKDALMILKCSKVILSNIKVLFLNEEASEVRTIMLAREVCPNIVCLSFHVPSGDEHEVRIALDSFPCLRQLFLQMTNTSFVSRFAFEERAKLLTFLEIKTTKITSVDLIFMSFMCPNLKALSISDHSVESSDPIDRHDYSPNRALDVFTNIETLDFKLNNAGTLFHFLQANSSLTSLYVKGVPNINYWSLYNVFMLLQPGCGFWPKLKEIFFSVIEEDPEIDKSLLLQVIEALPMLEHVGIFQDINGKYDDYGYSHLYFNGRSIKISSPSCYLKYSVDPLQRADTFSHATTSLSPPILASAFENCHWVYDLKYKYR